MPPALITRIPKAAPPHPSHRDFDSSLINCLPTKTGHERGGGAREACIARSVRPNGVTGNGVRQLMPGGGARAGGRSGPLVESREISSLYLELFLAAAGSASR